MPDDRDRARRSYARRQSLAAARVSRRRGNQALIGTVLTGLIVIGGALALSRMVGNPTTPTASRPANPCPTPSSAPVATAPHFAEAPAKTLAEGKVWVATLTTTCGAVELELYADKAPQTVSSFIFLSGNGFYAGSPCHRLTSSESLKVVQCGDPTGTGTGGPGYGYRIENAPPDGAYPAGTLAMARGTAVDSNGSQFFITYGDSTLPTDGGGYSIFGKVTKGLDVFTKVAAGGTTTGQSDGAPTRAISIERITVTPR